MMLCPISGMKETAKMRIFLSQSERILLLAADVATEYEEIYLLQGKEC